MPSDPAMRPADDHGVGRRGVAGCGDGGVGCGELHQVTAVDHPDGGAERDGPSMAGLARRPRPPARQEQGRPPRPPRRPRGRRSGRAPARARTVHGRPRPPSSRLLAGAPRSPRSMRHAATAPLILRRPPRPSAGPQTDCAGGHRPDRPLLRLLVDPDLDRARSGAGRQHLGLDGAGQLAQTARDSTVLDRALPLRPQQRQGVSQGGDHLGLGRHHAVQPEHRGRRGAPAPRHHRRRPRWLARAEGGDRSSPDRPARRPRTPTPPASAAPPPGPPGRGRRRPARTQRSPRPAGAYA